MKDIKIIGVSGKIGVGKDEVCKIIQKVTGKESPSLPNNIALKLKEDFDIFDSEWRIKKFASTLKKIVSLLTGCSEYDLEDQDFKNRELPEEWRVYNELGYPSIYTYRSALQIIGTNLFRDQFHENTWVNALLSNIQDHEKVLISDCRFENEAKAIKNKGGIVVRVERPSIASTSTHPSETALDNYTEFDYKIVNDGSIIELKAKVIEMLKHFKII